MDKTVLVNNLAWLEKWMTTLEVEAAKIGAAGTGEARAAALKIIEELEALSEELQVLVQKM